MQDSPAALLAFFGQTDSTIQRVLSEAMSRGAEFADLYFQHSRSTSIGLEDGIISRANASVDRGVGIRAVMGDQVGYAYSENLDLEPMLNAARVAATIASGSKNVAPQSVQARTAPQRYGIKRQWEDVSVSERLPMLRKAESMARGMESSIEKISASWGDSDERVLIVTSEGVMISDRRPMATLRLSVTANKNGVRQTNGTAICRRDELETFTDSLLQSEIRKAVDNTMILFEAKRPPAGEMPVVLAAGASGILLHEAIGHGLEADFNRKGTSIYSTLLNQKVAPDFVTVVDDGTQPNDRGALNVDDEGQPAENTVLIEKGVLRSYLHDRISAKHYKTRPTGSGRRESFRHVPIPRMRSTYMLNGPHSYDEIVKSVDRGIIAEKFWNGQVQIGAGDYTFYVKNGWLIEGGKITAPIKDVNIIGNGPDTLRNITMAASDTKLDGGGWVCGKDGQGVPVSLGIPTVLVKKLTVGGLNG
ncbi:MAG TPA: TldD/PmbA family protein [Planctomycetota bacterium]|nr:TldD/PmbA family protein [Planctomycetota bacterium]